MFEKKLEQNNDGKLNEILEQLEISNEEFISRAENIKKEIDDYIEAVDSYKNSEKGKEVMKNSTEILNVLAYAKEKEYNDMIEEQLEAWNKIENKYTRKDIEEALKQYHYSIIENGNKSFKKLFPEIKENKNNLDKNFAKEKIEEYLKLLDIGMCKSTNIIDTYYLINFRQFSINLEH